MRDNDAREQRTRRQILLGAVGAAAGLVAAACGGSDATDQGPPGSDDGPPDPDQGGIPGCEAIDFVMGNPHRAGNRHSVFVPIADVIAGVEMTYDITGESDHPHTIVVTAADFALIRDGQDAMVTSSFDDRHDHDVFLFCAGT